MPRRLLDQNAMREQRRQHLLQDRLVFTFERTIAQCLSEVSMDMVEIYASTRNVPKADALIPKLQEVYVKLVLATVQTFSSRIEDQGKNAGLLLEVKEDFADIMARVALNYVAQEAVRSRIVSVSDTTRALIIGVIEKGYDNGDTQSAIVNSLVDLVPGMSRTRARVIARTEVHGAANHGANEAAKETGLKLRKEWNAVDGPRTRDTHKEADGQTVEMDEKFQVGDDRLEYPGDPSGSAKEVIACRCSVSHIVIDD